MTNLDKKIQELKEAEEQRRQLNDKIYVLRATIFGIYRTGDDNYELIRRDATVIRQMFGKSRSELGEEEFAEYTNFLYRRKKEYDFRRCAMIASVLLPLKNAREDVRILKDLVFAKKITPKDCDYIIVNYDKVVKEAKRLQAEELIQSLGKSPDEQE